jgi:hypothetical protein
MDTKNLVRIEAVCGGGIVNSSDYCPCFNDDKNYDNFVHWNVRVDIKTGIAYSISDAE